jgi:hypothetical protein
MIAAKHNIPSPEAYFAWETQQLEKHEYLDDQVYAMSSGSVNHGRMATRSISKASTSASRSNKSIAISFSPQKPHVDATLPRKFLH